VIWGQVGKVLETGLSFVFAVVVIRQLGPVDYGHYSLVSNVVVVGLLLASLGINEILGSQIPKLVVEGNSRSARKLVWQMLSLRLGSIALAVIALIALRQFLAVVFKTPEFASTIVWISLLLVFTGLGDMLQGLFTALLDMKFVTFSRTLGIALSVCLASGSFAWQGPSVQGAVVAWALGWAVMVALALLKLRGRISGWHEGTAQTPRVIKYGLTIWVGNLLSFGLTIYSSNLLLGILTNDTRQVGFYNAAVLTVARMYTLLMAGVAGIMLPTMVEARARSGETGLARAWRAYLGLLVVLMTPSSCLLLFYAYPLTRWIFGDAYLPAAGLMQIFVAIGMLAALFAGPVTMSFLYAIGRQTLMVASSAICGMLDIGLLLLLIPRWGAIGAVIADSVTNVLIGFALFMLYRWYVGPWPYPLELVVKIHAAAFGSFLIAYLLVPAFDWSGLMISMSVGLLLFVSVCAWLKPLAGLELPLNELGTRAKRVAQWFV
jgi:O-antigen/teichoic acid export membrane protein